MNSGASSRGAVWNAVKTSLDRLPSISPVYVCLLVEDGSLYPVDALPGPQIAQGEAGAACVKDIGPLPCTAWFQTERTARQSGAGTERRRTRSDPPGDSCSE
jgi:hypothetical protein